MKKRKMKTTADVSRVRRGTYSVTNLINPPEGCNPGQLYYTSPELKQTPIGEKRKWSIPRSIVADKNWLYICDTGSVYRVDPTNGEIKPPQRFKGFPCAALTRSLWIHKKWLYATARAQINGDLFVDIYRVKRSNPNKQAKLVASQVRMDIPSTDTSQDAVVFVIVG
jgi:outer membrane protein assembly factor BamB